MQLPTDQFTMVTDPYIISLLHPQVKDEIVQVSEWLQLFFNLYGTKI